MVSNIKINVEHVSKVFKMYDTPLDKMKEALSLSGKKLHTDFYAIKDLSFDVKSGEILGIMGRNGSGKSTLLKMITGIFEPSEGKIAVTGKISSLLELGTGFNMEYTGIENIYFYGTLMGFTKKMMDEKIESIISFAEIGDYIYQPVKTYSSGMFARLAFSCAINVEPDILIVDEILSVGDMRFQAKCFNKFKEFRDKGVTILYVGHDVGMMRTFCSRAMWINKGKLVDIGDTTFISAKYTEFMYLNDINNFTDYTRLGKSAEKNDNITTNTDDISEQTINIKQDSTKAKDSRFPECIAHWGTNIGLIKEVNLTNKTGDKLNHFAPDDSIKIEVIFDVPPDIVYDFFSVAVSIKNCEGTDIIVKTTYDEKITLQNNAVVGKAEFEFKTYLAKGEYYIVVALENRENTATVYYEYIEGIKYFKVFTNKRIFGIFDPNASISFSLCEEKDNG